ncbi:MAG: signal peptidase I [Treponema sp.]|jgi:signal peptidase I|nr:signal peptidase I [Treponema sp.]
MAEKQFDYFYQLHKEIQLKIRNSILYVLSVFLFVSFFLRFITFPVTVQSVSMEPDFAPHSFVFVTPLAAAHAEFPVFASVDRGDVVLISPDVPVKTGLPLQILERVVSFFTFQHISVLNYQHLVSRSPALSRLAGMPGDTIYMRDHILYVKPLGASRFSTEFELAETKYNTIVKPVLVDWNSSIGVAGEFAELTLGENEYFFLCDNRSSSVDSRLWGPVTGERIAGKAWLRYLPIERFAKL